MSKRKRILLTLSSVVAMICAYGWFFGIATAIVLEARYFGWKAPVLKKTPVELADSSISSTPVRKLAFSGYEFEVPWEVDDEKTKVVGKMEVIAFRSGNAMLVSNQASKEFVNLVLKSGLDRDSFQKIYGKEALQSDYAMHQLMLQSTPDKVTLFTPRGEAVSRLMMLVMKGIAIPAPADTGLFSIRSQEFRGFQYGDPQKRPARIIVDLLGDDGGIEFNMGQKKDGSGPAVTQAELNRLIQSTRRVPVQLSGTEREERPPQKAVATTALRN